MTARTTSRNASRPRAAYPDTVGERRPFPALPGTVAVRGAGGAFGDGVKKIYGKKIRGAEAKTRAAGQDRA
ncbi:hypothetical protein GCM10010219_20330 [Streptomyces netropsis]|nr:hypothetical protein GCM10010219_20330 [Streptomyces netropsis]